MNDERAAEVMVKAALFFDLDETEKHAADLVERQLAALRAEGFDLYRPEDHVAISIVDDAGPGEASRWGPSAAAMDALEHSRPGRYRLVPVGGEG